LALAVRRLLVPDASADSRSTRRPRPVFFPHADALTTSADYFMAMSPVSIVPVPHRAHAELLAPESQHFPVESDVLRVPLLSRRF
jgi:hypothetical protein